MLAVGALDETIQAVRESPRVSIRISTYTLWLESEQVPSSRDDWHIDRIGAISGTGQTERYDATDYTKRRSFAVMSHFMTENARQDNRFYSDKISTEFVLQPSSVKLPDCWLATKEVQSRIAACMAPGYDSIHCGLGVATAFSSRAIHRPGLASEPGWRFMIRVGAYLSNTVCSPYEDHISIYVPFCTPGAPGHGLRIVGTKEENPGGRPWSYPITADDRVHALFTERGLCRDPASAGTAVERMRNAVETS